MVEPCILNRRTNYEALYKSVMYTMGRIFWIANQIRAQTLTRNTPHGKTHLQVKIDAVELQTEF